MRRESLPFTFPIRISVFALSRILRVVKSRKKITVNKNVPTTY